MNRNPMRRNWRLSALTLALVASLSLMACGKNSNQAAGGAQGQAQVVSVVTVAPTSVVLDSSLSGRLQPIREAQIIARATGVVQKRLFAEGSYVKAGAPLFQIENGSYVADLETARASLATAEANLAKANADLVRYRPLVQANAISKQEYDAAIAQQRLSRAQVQSANAAIKTARINVGHAYVTAPISGHIGKALVTEGALVSQSSATQLALIQQTDTLYVDLSQSATTVMKLRQAMAEGKLQMVDGNVPVTILLDDGSEYNLKGRLLFTDLSVNENTGQVSLRAEVPNPAGLLMPGMFVQVKVPQAQVNNAVLIPQQAVTRGTSGDSVMVVKQDGSYEKRTITISQNQGNNWVVTGGLNAGDQVIVDGMSVVQMTGAQKVQTKPWQENAQNNTQNNAQKNAQSTDASAAKPADQSAEKPAAESVEKK